MISLIRLAASLIFSFMIIGCAFAQSSDSNGTLRILTKPIAPFVVKSGDDLSGFSIDLWQEIATERGWEYEWDYRETLGEVLDAVRAGEGDAAIAAISITAERETFVDFSHSFFRSGLQIMVPAGGGGTGNQIWQAVKDLFTSVAFFYAALIFLGSVLIVSNITWLLERKHNDHFSKAYLPGLWDAFWWAIVTITTVGYGDKAPKGVSGRVFALFWMIFGYFMFAYFTAAVTSTVTIQELRGNIQGPDDLFDKRVAVIAGSTSAQYLERRGIRYDVSPVQNIEEAYALLSDGEIDAIVHDAPVLQFHVAGAGKGEFRLAGSVFNDDQYGIALPTASPLLEDVNRSILNLRENGTYARIYERWFGE